jgi:methyl-accepting chemotaxis protein
MLFIRKKIILNKKFQLGISLKAIILPLATTLAISAALLYFSINTNFLIKSNNKHISEIVSNQDSMIDMFLSTPALQQSANPTVKNGVATFEKNIGMLKQINKNSALITRSSSLLFKFLVAMTIIQTIVIFSLFIFYSHKITGPMHVMSNYLKDIQKGLSPSFRPLRKNDEFKDFYKEFCDTIDMMRKK